MMVLVIMQIKNVNGLEKFIQKELKIHVIGNKKINNKDKNIVVVGKKKNVLIKKCTEGDRKCSWKGIILTSIWKKWLYLETS